MKSVMEGLLGREGEGEEGCKETGNLVSKGRRDTVETKGGWRGRTVAALRSFTFVSTSPQTSDR